ncbi:uncharacterized protein LOC142357047 [Convolutriloba macropyga]|uniref:uncharacterized protein LOC142357047 n=1 Tax=Convolutriloba macropyga TaxID=536237 RepID=UPI003F524F71
MPVPPPPQRCGLGPSAENAITTDTLSLEQRPAERCGGKRVDGTEPCLSIQVGSSIPSWRTYVSTSTDHGASWAEPKELVPGNEGGRGCVKNKPLLLPSGELITGASLEEHRGQWRAFMDHSPDGVTWTAGDVLKIQGGEAVRLIQPALWQSSTTDVHAFFRTTNWLLYRADSTDGGQTWGEAYSTNLENSNSGVDVARLADGTLLLVSNAVPHRPVKGDRRLIRSPLRVAASKDNGQTWSSYWDVETGPSVYSYPAIVPWEDPQQGVGFSLTYTWMRRDICFVSMSLQEFEEISSAYYADT